MRSRHVVATVAVGARFRQLHRGAFGPSLERYASRHNYELVVVDVPLLPTPGRAEKESGFSRYLLPRLPQVAGFDSEIATAVNSGCFLCEPRRHADWLEAFARQHAPIAADHPRGLHYEQAAFGMSLQRDGIATLLPERWNRIWPVARWSELGTPRHGNPRARLAALSLIRQALAQGVFLHFTGGLDHDLAAASQRMSSASTGSIVE